MSDYKPWDMSFGYLHAAVIQVRNDRIWVDDLVKERKRKGLTQGDVAERMGVTQRAIVRIENGLRSPRVETLAKYAVAIGAVVEHVVSSVVTSGERDND